MLFAQSHAIYSICILIHIYLHAYILLYDDWTLREFVDAHTNVSNITFSA